MKGDSIPYGRNKVNNKNLKVRVNKKYWEATKSMPF